MWTLLAAGVAAAADCCPPTLLVCAPLLSCCREQPQIIEYIKLKAQVAELQKEAADWQRKQEWPTTQPHAAPSQGRR